MKITFISWERHHRRSELLAQHLGAKIHFVQSGRRARLLRGPARYLLQGLVAAVRYVVQGWQTWRVLAQDRPDVVVVQNPPIFGVLVASICARWYGGQYGIDSHSGAFLHPKWRWTLGLHRVLSRRALVTIVHNRAQEKIVRQWGCPYCVLAYTPGDYPIGGRFPLNGQYNVAVINTGKEDEPLDVVFGAAGAVPEATFYVTGDTERIPPALLAQKPDNCHLTSYLPYEQYVSLLRGADVVLDLTTADDTLLMGAFEAVSLGTPLIVSRWPLLQDYFHLGTLHVPNTVEGVSEGIRTAQREQTTLRCDILILRDQLEAEWKQQFAELRHLLEEHPVRDSGPIGTRQIGDR